MKVIKLSTNGDTSVYSDGVFKAIGRDRVYFVDGKLKSFSEKLSILCADDINMEVDTKLILSFDIKESSITFIKEKVPTESREIDGRKRLVLSLEKFYMLAIRDVLRGTTRNIVSPFITDDIRPNRLLIESRISSKVQERITSLGYPVLISAVLVSNIDYPNSVRNMREEIKQVQLIEQKKIAEAEAQLAQAKRAVQVEAERSKVIIVKAKGQAAQNEILSKSLTPEFLMWRQLEVLEATSRVLSENENSTVFMMPYEMMNQTTLGSSITGKLMNLD